MLLLILLVFDLRDVALFVDGLAIFANLCGFQRDGLATDRALGEDFRYEAVSFRQQKSHFQKNRSTELGVAGLLEHQDDALKVRLHQGEVAEGHGGRVLRPFVRRHTVFQVR